MARKRARTARCARALPRLAGEAGRRPHGAKPRTLNRQPHSALASPHSYCTAPSGVIPDSSTPGEFQLALGLALAAAQCAASCPADAVAAAAAARNLVGLATSWPQCVDCVSQAAELLSQTQREALVEAAFTAQLNERTPYSDRPCLQQGNTTLPDELVRRYVGEPCQQWDQGRIFGDVNKLLVLGGEEWGEEGELLRASAVQEILVLVNGEAIQRRVASPAASLSIRVAPINITVEEAEEALEEMKKALEDAALEGQMGPWESGSEDSSIAVHTAFSDDGVVPGSFSRLLAEETESSYLLFSVNFALVSASSLPPNAPQKRGPLLRAACVCSRRWSLSSFSTAPTP